MLSVLYLLGIRAECVVPRFLPVTLLAGFPAASATIGLAALGSGGRARWGLVALAALELAWAAVSAAMVGFAIAWRSG